MTRRTLIFFTSADPGSNATPARTAYHFARVAADAGLAAEVRLAGDAVRLALPGGITDDAPGPELRQRVAEGVDGPFLVSL